MILAMFANPDLFGSEELDMALLETEGSYALTEWLMASLRLRCSVKVKALLIYILRDWRISRGSGGSDPGLG